MMHVDDEASSTRRKEERYSKQARNASRAEGKETAAQSTSAGPGLFFFKFKLKTQISALEFKIAKRQKKFGVDYMTLVEERESQMALKQCLRVALVDVAALQEKLNEFYDKLEEVEPKKSEVHRPDGAGVFKSARSAPAVEEKSEAESVPSPKPKKKKVKKPSGDNPETVDSDVEKKKSTKKKKSSKKKKKAGGEDGQGKKSTSENEE